MARSSDGPVQTVPLREAVLCIDCEMVTNSRNGQCLACGSHAVMNIAAALGGTLRSEVQASPAQPARVINIRQGRL